MRFAIEGTWFKGVGNVGSEVVIENEEGEELRLTPFEALELMDTLLRNAEMLRDMDRQGKEKQKGK